jgi:hypothetical protein
MCRMTSELKSAGSELQVIGDSVAPRDIGNRHLRAILRRSRHLTTPGAKCARPSGGCDRIALPDREPSSR